MFLAILQIVGTALAAYGAYQQGQAVRAQNRYQARVAKYNQKVAEMEGQFAVQQANKKAGEQKQKARRVAASQKAAQASSGFVVGEGSFGDILEDTALLGQIDAEAIKYEGSLAAYRAKEQARMYGKQGQMYSSAASSANFGSFLDTGSTLLSGLSTVDYGKFTKKPQ